MNEKILLVDDEETNLRLLTKWLVPLGYEIEFAANGEEAVRKVRENPPDLIVLDIKKFGSSPLLTFLLFDRKKTYQDPSRLLCLHWHCICANRGIIRVLGEKHPDT